MSINEFVKHSIVTNTPTNDYQAANKKYVDDKTKKYEILYNFSYGEELVIQHNLGKTITVNVWKIEQGGYGGNEYEISYSSPSALLIKQWDGYFSVKAAVPGLYRIVYF